MNYIIRKTEPSEYSAAMELTWKTFLEYEAPEYSEEGIEQFRKDIIVNSDFKQACLSGKNQIWGAYNKNNSLLGIMAVRNINHICLAFVLSEYQRKGIGEALFQSILSDLPKSGNKVSIITVNSSPYAIPFYHHLGFIDTNSEQTINGIRFIPMKYQIL